MEPKEEHVITENETAERKIDHKTVIITEVGEKDLTFFAQDCDKGACYNPLNVLQCEYFRCYSYRDSLFRTATREDDGAASYRHDNKPTAARRLHTAQRRLVCGQVL